MNEVKRTPVYDAHVALGGKIVDFAGYELPIQYSGIQEEHEAVRNYAGIFDVSHMGEIMVEGVEALEAVQYLLSNDVTKLVDGQVLYTLMCYENGSVVDDLLIYRKNENNFLLVVNAANIEKDYEWIESKLAEKNVFVSNLSNDYGQLALQGPQAQRILQKLVPFDLNDLTFFHFKESVDIKGISALVSRTGYTGEDGFEIYVNEDQVLKLWNLLLASDEQLKPIGLGARDTLRFESNLPLYGHEISDEITPLEAGLKMFAPLDQKDDFIGKDALIKSVEEGVKRKLIGIALEKGIARAGAEIYKDGEKVGYVTTGYMSPTLNKSVALGLVNKSAGKIGDALTVKVRKKEFPCKIVSKKFYQKKYKKLS
jgi:aminomethyltransferase